LGLRILKIGADPVLDKQTISVVVPVFNEIEVLPELIKRLEKVIIEQLQPYSIEVIFVNDGSSDGSRMFLSQLVSIDSKYRVINLSRNFGHQAAVMAGLRAAKGSAIVITDADLQDPPEVIPQLIEEWRNGAEVVHAVRKTRLSESVVKQTTAKLF
jgi:polyisoprenyl-phosphate glycosyltransferase